MSNLKKFNNRVIILCIPALAGFGLFYIYPAVKSMYFSLIDNTNTKNFVFFDNYISVLGNKYFRLALWNTALFSIIGVALLLGVSLAVSFALLKMSGGHSFIKRFFIMPMLLPTAGIIAAWQLFFDNPGYFGLMKTSGFYVVLPVYLIYIWKNTGINIIIITAAASKIPREIFEAVSLEGAKGFAIFRKITLPCIAPALFFAGVLSFVNSLKIFKESYLFFGTAYPPDSAYILQYYMNNHFQKLNYQILSSATVIFTVIISAVIIIFYAAENKFSKDTY